jgi:hypothetical protein
MVSLEYPDYEGNLAQWARMVGPEEMDMMEETEDPRIATVYPVVGVNPVILALTELRDREEIPLTE